MLTLKMSVEIIEHVVDDSFKLSVLSSILYSVCKVWFFKIIFVSFRLLSVLRGHSVFSSPPQRPMTSDFEEFLSQILSITFFVLERASISLFHVECQTRELLVPFYNIFGMTRSLTGDWTRDLPHSKSALYQ